MDFSKNRFLKLANVECPIIGGPMYPCSNPELVAAISEAGALGVVQPLSLTFVYGYEFRAGLKYIRSLTKKPIGLNALIEASSQKYLDRQKRFVDEALEEGVRFIITSLGNPRWVVERAKQVGAVVFHDVTSPQWAKKAVDAGVDGLICVNARAGGHAGSMTAGELFEDLSRLALPLVCAGGVGNAEEFRHMLELGYDAVQMGTRFIATTECKADERYKQAIVQASEKDIVLTKKITGVNVAVINTPYIQKMGTEPGPLVSYLLHHPRAKHWMRALYSVQALFALKKVIRKPSVGDDYWQAGKSVEGIEEIKSAGEVIGDFMRSLR